MGASRRVYTSGLVRIGQRWQSREDGRTYAITQIHRKDRMVDLKVDPPALSAPRFTVPFNDLRRRYILLPQRRRH